MHQVLTLERKATHISSRVMMLSGETPESKLCEAHVVHLHRELCGTMRTSHYKPTSNKHSA